MLLEEESSPCPMDCGVPSDSFSPFVHLPTPTFFGTITGYQWMLTQIVGAIQNTHYMGRFSSCTVAVKNGAVLICVIVTVGSSRSIYHNLLLMCRCLSEYVVIVNSIICRK